MPIVPVRNLGQLGLLTDPAAFDLPPQAWTRARNVRFHGNKISRAASFRQLRSGLSLTTPVFAYAYADADGGDRVITADRTGNIRSYRIDEERDINPIGVTRAALDAPWSGVTLSGVHYINRGDAVPLKLVPGALRLAPMANWPESWRCRVLRAFRGALFALTTTEGGTEYANRLRWSTFAQFGQEPASWDATSTTNTAGTTLLPDLTGPLHDALQLRDALFVYGQEGVYVVRMIGGRSIFSFEPLWRDLSIIGTNCVVEQGGRHIVFCRDDIIAHNGVQRSSIVDGKVRARLFSSIDWDYEHVCSVVHDRVRSEVMFCYRSVGSDTYWPWGEHATEAAVWNYARDTWSFRDLPNVGVAAQATASLAQAWDTSDRAWDDASQSWNSAGTNGTEAPVFPAIPGAGQPVAKLLILDGYDEGNRFGLPLDPHFRPDAMVERSGMDMDELQVELRGYKRIRTLYPQFRITGEVSVEGSVGGALYPNAPTSWRPFKSLDPARGYRIDQLQGGRFLGVRFRFRGEGGFTLSGYDLDVVQLGSR